MSHLRPSPLPAHLLYPPPPPPQQQQQRKKQPGEAKGGQSLAAVQATADDAVLGKLSAVAMGYMRDPHLHLFNRRKGVKRPPIINRGNFARVRCVDRIIDAFLSTCLDPATPLAPLTPLMAPTPGGGDNITSTPGLPGPPPTSFPLRTREEEEDKQQQQQQQQQSSGSEAGTGRKPPLPPSPFSLRSGAGEETRGRRPSCDEQPQHLLPTSLRPATVATTTTTTTTTTAAAAAVGDTAAPPSSRRPPVSPPLSPAWKAALVLSPRGTGPVAVESPFSRAPPGSSPSARAPAPGGASLSTPNTTLFPLTVKALSKPREHTAAGDGAVGDIAAGEGGGERGREGVGGDEEGRLLSMAVDGEEDKGYGCCCQIVSLGAGKDTTLFRLKESFAQGHNKAQKQQQQQQYRQQQLVVQGEGSSSCLGGGGAFFRYFEVDLPDVARHKKAVIESSPELRRLVGLPPKSKEAPQAQSHAHSGSGLLGTAASAIADRRREKERESESEESESETEAAGGGREGGRTQTQHQNQNQNENENNSAVLLRSEAYALVEADLRDVKELERALRSAGCDVGLPTLLLAECVLVYMPGDGSRRLAQWAGAAFSRSLFVNYDMTNGDDKFGHMMINNIEDMGCHLPGLRAYPTLQDQKRRFLPNDACSPMPAAATTVGDTAVGDTAAPVVVVGAGADLSTGEGGEGAAAAAAGAAEAIGDTATWQEVSTLPMLSAYDTMVSVSERTRVNRIEPLDELEEWNLIMTHYCLTLAANGQDCVALLRSLIPPQQRA